MSPCVVFIDEVEKALAGFGGQGDSGVSTRLFGTMLTWLSDRTSETFVVATCNDVSKLPPEFSRAERWTVLSFLDLPTAEEREAIWRLYRSQFGVPASQETSTPSHFFLAFASRRRHNPPLSVPHASEPRGVFSAPPCS